MVILIITCQLDGLLRPMDLMILSKPEIMGQTNMVQARLGMLPKPHPMWGKNVINHSIKLSKLS